MATTSDAVTVSFCDTAIKVWDRMLGNQHVRDRILAAEQQFGKSTPFDSVYKLEAICTKGKTTEQCLWLVNHMVDVITDGLAQTQEFSHRTLTGKGMGNKGTLDLFLYKLEMKNYFVEFADTSGFTTHVKSCLHSILDHATYREKYGFKKKRKSLQFLSILPESGRMFLQCVTDPSRWMKLTHGISAVAAFGSANQILDAVC